MLLTKQQATAVAQCLTVLKPSKGIAAIEFPRGLKIVQMHDASIFVHSAPPGGRVSVENHADAMAFRTAYGVA